MTIEEGLSKMIEAIDFLRDNGVEHMDNYDVREFCEELKAQLEGALVIPKGYEVIFYTANELIGLERLADGKHFMSRLGGCDDKDLRDCLEQIEGGDL